MTLRYISFSSITLISSALALITNSDTRSASSASWRRVMSVHTETEPMSWSRPSNSGELCTRQRRVLPSGRCRVSSAPPSWSPRQGVAFGQQALAVVGAQQIERRPADQAVARSAQQRGHGRVEVGAAAVHVQEPVALARRAQQLFQQLVLVGQRAVDGVQPRHVLQGAFGTDDAAVAPQGLAGAAQHDRAAGGGDHRGFQLDRRARAQGGVQGRTRRRAVALGNHPEGVFQAQPRRWRQVHQAQSVRGQPQLPAAGVEFPATHPGDGAGAVQQVDGAAHFASA